MNKDEMNQTKVKKVKWVIVAILIVCVVPLLVHALNTRHYAISDEIERAKIDTERLLRKYEKTEDATEIRSWLIEGRTEAPSAQVHVTLGHWGLENQNGFVMILDGIPSKQRDEFIERFCNSLNQSSLGKEDFEKAFMGHTSITIAGIIDKLN